MGSDYGCDDDLETVTEPDEESDIDGEYFPLTISERVVGASRKRPRDEIDTLGQCASNHDSGVFHWTGSMCRFQGSVEGESMRNSVKPQPGDPSRFIDTWYAGIMVYRDLFSIVRTERLAIAKRQAQRASDAASGHTRAELTTTVRAAEHMISAFPESALTPLRAVAQ